MTILVQQQLREATERLICEGENCWPATVERFTELANPAAVLALLDEVDRLTRAAKYCEDIDATHENHRETMLYDLALERDQLKAENAELRRDTERCRWLRNSAPSRLAAGPVIAMAEADGSLLARADGHEVLLGREDADAAIDQAMTKEQQV